IFRPARQRERDRRPRPQLRREQRCARAPPAADLCAAGVQHADEPPGPDVVACLGCVWLPVVEIAFVADKVAVEPDAGDPARGWPAGAGEGEGAGEVWCWFVEAAPVGSRGVEDGEGAGEVGHAVFSLLLTGRSGSLLPGRRTYHSQNWRVTADRSVPAARVAVSRSSQSWSSAPRMTRCLCLCRCWARRSSSVTMGQSSCVACHRSTLLP